MTRRYDSEGARRRILSACVRLFIEKGYTNTKMTEIIGAADVSASTFHNIFQTKDGVLEELTDVMFENQFGIARSIVGQDAAPVLLYAVETAIQMTLTERNENLREIYVEAYTQPRIMEQIHRQTSAVLHGIFGAYLPGSTESDFYELEIGTAGMMRGYMARPCDIYFTLAHKLERFLRMSLSAYSVPKPEQDEVIASVLALDICAIADRVMQQLFAVLAMKFDFTLTTEQKP